MRAGFHAHDGWYFRRNDDGSVTIEVAESGSNDTLYQALTVDPDTWASVIASVSGCGEDAATWQAARNLHMPTTVDVSST